MEQSRFVDVSKKDLDEFSCGICQLIVVTPVETQCCQQLYCNSCITRWLEDNNTCPHDRKSLTPRQLTTPSRILMNLLNRMQVKCEFHDKGCRVIDSYEAIGNHTKTCDKNPDQVCKKCGVKGRHDCIEMLKEKVTKLEKELKEPCLTDEYDLDESGSFYDYFHKSNKYYEKMQADITKAFEMEGQDDDPDMKEVIVTIIVQMTKLHIGSSQICGAGLSRIDDLVKDVNDDLLPESVVHSVIDISLDAMRYHNKDFKVQLNGLSIISSCIEKCTRQNIFRFVKQSLDNAIHFEQDDFRKVSLMIVSRSCHILTKAEKTYLGTRQDYVDALLKLIKDNHANDASDEKSIVMSATQLFVSVTDESPEVCKMFTAKDGVDVYLEVLKQTRVEGNVLVSLIICLRNVVEIESLRRAFRDEQLFTCISDAIDSSNQQISYPAAGIMAYLVISDILTNNAIKRVKNQMEKAIEKWEMDSEFITYETLNCVWYMIKESKLDEIKLYALWTVQYCIKINREKYLKMVQEDNGMVIIRNLLKSTWSRRVKRYCEAIIAIV